MPLVRASRSGLRGLGLATRRSGHRGQRLRQGAAARRGDKGRRDKTQRPGLRNLAVQSGHMRGFFGHKAVVVHNPIMESRHALILDPHPRALPITICQPHLHKAQAQGKPSQCRAIKPLHTVTNHRGHATPAPRPVEHNAKQHLRAGQPVVAVLRGHIVHFKARPARRDIHQPQRARIVLAKTKIR